MPTQLAPTTAMAVSQWPSAVAARAPAWADAHGERLRELLGTSREADTAVRVSVTSLAANSARSYSCFVRQFVDFCRIRGISFNPAKPKPDYVCFSWHRCTTAERFSRSGQRTSFLPSTASTSTCSGWSRARARAVTSPRSSPAGSKSAPMVTPW